MLGTAADGERDVGYFKTAFSISAGSKAVFAVAH